MQEFINNYGAIIISIITFIGALATAIATMRNGIVANKKISKLNNDIQITQNGIVEAFKKAKISPELKLSISSKVDTILNEWANKSLKLIQDNEELRTKLAVANTKILSYTAAFNKLSNEEKAEINSLINEVTEKDITIEV